MASDELSSHGRLGFPRQDDAAQEAFDDPQTQPALHPVWPVIGACAPAEVAPEPATATAAAEQGVEGGVEGGIVGGVVGGIVGGLTAMPPR